MKQFTARHPWAILAAGAAIQILTGLPAAWGVFQQPVMDEFSLTEDGAGYAFGILIAAFGVGCVIGGFLQDKKGPRCAALWGTGLLCGGFFAAALLPGEKGGWFWAVFSIPAGLGTAFLYPSIQSCAQKWYAGRKGLATGVIGGAVGLSGAFLTGFVRTTLKGFGPVQGIRGAFWALGALTLPVCLVGSALLTDPPPAKQKPEEQGREKGTPALDLAPLQMPMLSDRIGRRPTDLILFGVSLGLSAAFLFAQGWLVVAVYAGLTFCYSALAAVLPSLSTDLFGLPHAGVNYGFLALGQSVGSLAFPFAANLWGLATGRHWLAMAGAAAGFVCIWALRPVRAQQPPRKN